MPHLLLGFESIQESKEPRLKDGKIKSKPTGREEIKMTFIDADKGKVIEIEGTMIDVKQVERAPTWGEAQTASQVLSGKNVMEKVDEKAHARITAERDTYRQKFTSAQTQITKHQETIDARDKEVLELKGKLKEFNEEEQAIVGAALDGHIETLALTQDFKGYERAKRLFRRFTGKPWASEFGDDDDMEDD